MKKIIIIIPYFGKLPNYFPLFLESCRFNSSIDWLLIIDDKEIYEYPINVKVIYWTFREIRSYIQNKFEFTISLQNPYKLCDFRGAYGYIFEEFIFGYDFWGYGDMDVIYGNIRKFLNPKVLKENERVFLLGHLSLYKNNEKMNMLFKTAFKGKEYYKYVFSYPENYVFDEGKMNVYLLEKNIKFYHRNVIGDINVFQKNFQLVHYALDSPGKYKYFEIKNEPTLIFKWKKGRLIGYFSACLENTTIFKREFVYIHLQKRKMLIKNNSKDAYLIVPNEFKDIDEAEKIFHKYSKKKKKISTYIKYIFIYKWRTLRNKVYYNMRTFFNKW